VLSIFSFFERMTIENRGTEGQTNEAITEEAHIKSKSTANHDRQQGHSFSFCLRRNSGSQQQEQKSKINGIAISHKTHLGDVHFVRQKAFQTAHRWDLPWGALSGAL
jgi:hypothetical protein